MPPHRVVALLALAQVWTAAALAIDFADAPMTPNNGDCIGYPTDPSKLPADVRRALDAVNATYRKEANDGDAQFLRATGDAGKRWKQETAASTQRMLAGLRSAESLFPALPQVGRNGELPSEEEHNHWAVKQAQWHLAVVKVENRQRQEEAEAQLRFVERGGDTVALLVLQKNVEQLLETCKRDGERIYEK